MSVTMPTLIFFSGSAVAAGSLEPDEDSSSSPQAATTVPMQSASTAISSSRRNFPFTDSSPVVHGLHTPLQMARQPIGTCGMSLLNSR